MGLERGRGGGKGFECRTQSQDYVLQAAEGADPELSEQQTLLQGTARASGAPWHPPAPHTRPGDSRVWDRGLSRCPGPGIPAKQAGFGGGKIQRICGVKEESLK